MGFWKTMTSVHVKEMWRFQTLRWFLVGVEAGPYLGFPRSHDVYGDGSIVCVPAPGHTPGSIIVFVTLPNNVRYALVGDLVWQREGLTNLEDAYCSQGCGPTSILTAHAKTSCAWLPS
jgi:glyoxylase-like metal-dependent hydrolase (beta-lactamase superfamily II)